MHSVLLRQYGKERVYSAYTNPPSAAIDALRSRSIEERGAYRVISGHIGPDVDLVRVFQRRVTYVTLLRDPVDRVLSTYFYVLRSERHPAHATVRSLSLDEVIRSGVLPLIDNGQTRMLSGLDTEDVEYDQCTSSMLEAAINNLETRFALAGTVERFDESMLLLQDCFGWRLPLYRRRNVNRGRSTAEAIPAETVALICRFNRLDAELFHWASENLDRRIRAAGKRFAGRLRRFRVLNQLYGGLMQ